MPEADRNARCVGRQSEDEKARLTPRPIKLAAVHGFIQGADLAGTGIGVVAFSKHGGEDVFDRIGLFCPEHGRGVADLHALLRTFGEQVVECRGVGEGRGRADRRIGALRLAE